MNIHWARIGVRVTVNENPLVLVLVHHTWKGAWTMLGDLKCVVEKLRFGVSQLKIDSLILC